MSILINMEMPTDHPLWIIVHSDGTVEANEVSASRPVGWQTLRNAAVPVPPHGRLIDADALANKHFGKEFLSKVMTADKDDMGTALVNIPLVINNAPTIIPAEEDE